MQKKVDLSTSGDQLVEVVVERPDDQAPWTLAVRVRPVRGGDWSAPWRDTRRTYFTCFDALAAGKRQAAAMVAPHAAARD